MNVIVPDGSIYLWMYNQGLKGISIYEVSNALQQANKQVRQKDIDNYYRGFYKHNLYRGSYTDSMLSINQDKPRLFYTTQYSEYPDHPWEELPEIENRYVPCNKNGKPIIKWSKGCMSKIDAECMLACESLAENLKGTKYIVIDIDGDHGDEIHESTILSFKRYIRKTHTLYKPNKYYKTYPVSYHLTFKVNKIIPTMHFTKAHIDIVGNKMNSLRYFKNKLWNNIEPLTMTNETWNDIQKRIKRLEEK